MADTNPLFERMVNGLERFVSAVERAVSSYERRQPTTPTREPKRAARTRNRRPADCVVPTELDRARASVALKKAGIVKP